MDCTEFPQDVIDDVAHQRDNCPFVNKGKPGCLLDLKPELTEQDESGCYFHAACLKTWEQGSYDEDSNPEIETETCYAHPVYDGEGQQVADWG